MSETASLNDQPVERSGVRVEEGWVFKWKNGIADFYPFRTCYDLTLDGDIQRHNLAAYRLRTQLRAKHKAYAKEGRGWVHSLLSCLAIPFLSVAAFLVTLVTLPIFLVLWVIWLVIAIFRTMLMISLALTLKVFGRSVAKRYNPFA